MDKRLTCYLFEVGDGFEIGPAVVNPEYLDGRLKRITTTRQPDRTTVENWLQQVVEELGGLPWIECESESSPLYRLVNYELKLRDIQLRTMLSPDSRFYRVLDFPDIEITELLVARKLRNSLSTDSIDTLDRLQYKRAWPNYVEAYRKWVEKWALVDVDPDETTDDGQKVVDVMRDCLRLDEDGTLKPDEFKFYDISVNEGFWAFKDSPLGTYLMYWNGGSNVRLVPSGAFSLKPKLEGITVLEVANRPGEYWASRTALQQAGWLRRPVGRGKVVAANEESYLRATGLGFGFDTEGGIPAAPRRFEGALSVGKSELIIMAQEDMDDPNAVWIEVSVAKVGDLKAGSQLIVIHDDLELAAELKLQPYLSTLQGIASLSTSWEKFIRVGVDGQLALSIEIAST